MEIGVLGGCVSRPPFFSYYSHLFLKICSDMALVFTLIGNETLTTACGNRMWYGTCSSFWAFYPSSIIEMRERSGNQCGWNVLYRRVLSWSTIWKWSTCFSQWRYCIPPPPRFSSHIFPFVSHCLFVAWVCSFKITGSFNGDSISDATYEKGSFYDLPKSGAGFVCWCSFLDLSALLFWRKNRLYIVKKKVYFVLTL